jgi:hypothetical protein
MPWHRGYYIILVRFGPSFPFGHENPPRIPIALYLY